MGVPQVRFIVLPQADDRERLLYACRVAEKAYLDGQRVLVRLESADQARAFDELLWRFSDSSFVPHGIAEPGLAMDAPVALWSGGEPEADADVLVNLCADVPAWYGRFARIAELVDGDEARRSAGRERYRFYREQGLEPDSRNVGSSA